MIRLQIVRIKMLFVNKGIHRFMKANSKTTHFSPLLVLFLGILAVSTASIFIRFAQKEASSIVIAAYRLSLATLLLLPVALRSSRHELVHLRSRQIILILLSGVFLAFHFATWITSLEYTTVASSVVLVTTTPLWVGIFSPLILRERLARFVAMGLVVALLGGILVGMSESCTLSTLGFACPPLSTFAQGSTFWGNFLALSGAIFAAAYLLVGRSLRPTLSLIAYISTVYGVAAVALVAMAIFSGQPLFGFSPWVYLAFLALAVFPQLLGHSSFNYGLRYLSAALVSVALLGEPIGSTILAFIILKEVPTALEVVGGVVILVGIYIATRGQEQAS